MYSDETHTAIRKYCYPHFTGEKCDKAFSAMVSQNGNVYVYNVYAPLCHDDRISNNSKGTVSYLSQTQSDFKPSSLYFELLMLA